MAIRAKIELDAGAKTFATGLLIELIAALRCMRPGDLMAVFGSDRAVGTELEAWCRFTRNSLVDVTVEEGRHRWVIRCGEAPENADAGRPVGSRLWLYTNFDCNLVVRAVLDGRADAGAIGSPFLEDGARRATGAGGRIDGNLDVAAL